MSDEELWLLERERIFELLEIFVRAGQKLEHMKENPERYTVGNPPGELMKVIKNTDFAQDVVRFYRRNDTSSPEHKTQWIEEWGDYKLQ
jgi:hypothetical protein